MQRLFLIMWPFWLPRSERQKIRGYFKEGKHTWDQLRVDSDE